MFLDYLSYLRHSPRDIFAPWVVQDSIEDDVDCADKERHDDSDYDNDDTW